MPAKNREELDAIREVRNKLCKDLCERRKKAATVQDGNVVRRSGRKFNGNKRSPEGSRLFTGEEISLEEFLRKADFMAKVNRTFPRHFDKEGSRPRLRHLELSQETINKLRSIFFDEDGSLADSMRHEIDISIKNDPRYITFRNFSCAQERKDKRWQVPVRKHFSIESRRAVADILKEQGVYNPEFERLHDVALLFGGTEDQSLHHDVARQVTSWMKERPSTMEMVDKGNPITGWEIDRLEYNEAMESPFAPSSVLIGMSQTSDTLLGVQKDQVKRDSEGFCTILGGKKGQKFKIVRENDYLVVLKIPAGCQFTGDFPHAGVRNVRTGSDEDFLMRKMNRKIAEIGEKYQGTEHGNKLVEMMCSLKGLGSLCRLFCSTEMRNTEVYMPKNAVGFSKCLPNTPDPRCYQDDPKGRI
eukprot:CAMPEP_0118723340 /NCGR_PEP_ID=MMETSP0800-20121206/31950_1 /TAXON_ID=210618 ORGANISM="Striatella unipunctata, Strain CCMP2910" /NCGR_SAMPLE_ID=MMETSP0800 /ASSEMBLY_ACC=CAM_ASM_000638 /LENGTH=414 /DNA_ID=CAMNT_0006631757 /DNA_START=843 /DNA_END=2088 /DNA_ORIENTATION=-